MPFCVLSFSPVATNALNIASSRAFILSRAHQAYIGDAFLQINLDTIFYELSSHSAGEGVGTLTFTVLSQVGS
jgi:hypothetical protein